VIRGVAGAGRERGDVFVTIKTHPEDSARDVGDFERMLEGGQGRIVREVHLHALVELADVVVVRNSTVGLEALILGKPVVCLGQSAYSGKGFTYDVENPTELEGVLNRALLSPNPCAPPKGEVPSLSFLPPGKISFRSFFQSRGRGIQQALSDFGNSPRRHGFGPPRSGGAREDGGREERRGFRVIALVAARNEGDVIYHVIKALVDEGVEVYLIDHNSGDNTVEEASGWLNKGLIHIERFTGEGGAGDGDRYVWAELLRRKEELARELKADWFIHHDADEFRESPWPGVSLRDGIRVVDSLGYNAIDFDLFNFRPTDDSFEPGSDVRQSLRYYEDGADFDRVQIKAWKKGKTGIDLQSTGVTRQGSRAGRYFPSSLSSGTTL
jgi:hypothetical protein